MGFLKSLLSLGGLRRLGAIEEDYPKGPSSEAEARRFLEERVRGAGPMYWREPWNPESGPAPPFNLATRKVYRGVNRVILSARGIDDPRWLTDRQARALGHVPKEGQSGERLWYWQLEEEARLRRPDGTLVSGSEGRPLAMAIPLVRPIARRFTCHSVTALEPLSGPSLKDYPLKPREIPFDPASAFETLVEAAGAEIRIAKNSPALYRTGQDAIYLPPAGDFESQGLYYRTVLHELVHWTGHRGRLSRAGGRLGESGYAREEMVAEMASFMIAQDLKLPIDAAMGDISLSYLRLFSREMEVGSAYFRRVCADAERARAFLSDKVKRLEESAWLELLGDASPLIGERVDPALRSLMLEAMRGEERERQERGRELEARLLGQYGPQFTKSFLEGLLKDSGGRLGEREGEIGKEGDRFLLSLRKRPEEGLDSEGLDSEALAIEGASFYRPPAAALPRGPAKGPGPGRDSQILGSPSEEEAWESQDPPPFPEHVERQKYEGYYEAVGEEAQRRLRVAAAEKMLLEVGKLGPVEEDGHKRWMRIQGMGVEFSVEPWAKDVDFLIFLDECQRVGRETSRKLTYWRGKPPKDPEIRERTIYAAVMLIVEASRKLGYENLPFGLDQGEYRLAFYCQSGRHDESPGFLRINGRVVPVVSEIEDGEPVRAGIIFKSGSTEGLFAVRSVKVARDLQAALSNPLVPKFNCQGFPEAERLRAGQKRPMVRPEKPFPKISDEEGLEMVMRIKKRQEERGMGEKDLEPFITPSARR
ncbi:MAG: ssDNA-binding domain-containing protein [Deltaproteobacteria bacterium]|jgi:antirestriction protein ArdC|nr:ssDNA-binding domain-containing protein [Deltaproteobacteria bacterium]